jgi:ribosomal protein S4
MIVNFPWVVTVVWSVSPVAHLTSQDAGQKHLPSAQGPPPHGLSVCLSPPIRLLTSFQSWSPQNLYNLWQRTLGPKSKSISLKDTGSNTIFQERWLSKSVVRAYHGDYIKEKSFKRWYLPDTIPDVRPLRAIKHSDDTASLEDYARRKSRSERTDEEIAKKGMPPVGSLMFSEVERRIDTLVFRACFAESIYEARRLVIHGDVLLNGIKVCRK